MKIKKENKFGEKRLYTYFVAEITPLVVITSECDMSEDEIKTYGNAICEINDDLDNLIEYDEWAYREYGDTKIDYYTTARNLYNAGYRKITKIEE